MPSVNNPYAKRTKKDTSQRDEKGTTHQNEESNGNIGQSASSLGIPEISIGSTFSQAFSSLESTSQYQTVLKETSDIPVDARLEQERSEQRKFDLQEAAAAAAVGPNAPDRDHHVLLQPHVLYVSTKQRGNGILKYIRNVPFAFTKMVPDYIMSTTSCALFLSIKYHQLYSNYIHRRLGELKTDFQLRVLLVLVDVEDNANALLYLNKLAVTNNLTLILAWTEQEAARYLETYKVLDGKDASSIQKRESTNFQDQNADFMTACKPVNRTDANTILNHFSTIKAVAAASQDELALCEGLGPVKVQKLFDALHKPFSRKRTLERQQQKEDQLLVIEADENVNVDHEENDDH